MADTDDADREAAELIENAGPCHPNHRVDDGAGMDLPRAMSCDECVATAVAARLRERDERIVALETQRDASLRTAEALAVRVSACPLCSNSDPAQDRDVKR